MILLDTDHFSVFRYAGHPRAVALRSRLDAATDPDIEVTVITLEEQMRGWLAEIARHNDPARQVTVYERLQGLVELFSRWRIVPFDARAAAEFQRLRGERVRIKTMDLKIASTALIHDALLLSANLRDFRAVPGLRVEDWLT